MTEVGKKRLGKGLAALLGEEFSEGDMNKEKSFEDDGVDRAPIEFLSPNSNNPRKDFDDKGLEELATSMKKLGVLQPIVVRKNDQIRNSYEIIAGERRWRAAQKAGLHEVPIIIQNVSDEEALEIAIIENVQRKDLNALEEAAGYQRLMDEFGYTQENISELIGKSRSHVANVLRLLKLPDSIKRYIEEDKLSAGHARAVLVSSDPLSMAEEIIKNALNVRQAEELASRLKRGQSVEEGSSSGHRQNGDRLAQDVKVAIDSSSDDVNIKAVEKELYDILGIQVSISYDKKGAGEVRLEYKNLDQFDYIVKLLKAGKD